MRTEKKQQRSFPLAMLPSKVMDTEETSHHCPLLGQEAHLNWDLFLSHAICDTDLVSGLRQIS